ncbi:L,D-transpeptidase [Pseudonocardiaceae bacterium YIM PH 21723]|nr:L,D-transpeptidase [Pseudonocardiaceae bacterium YIM PH 21723]
MKVATVLTGAVLVLTGCGGAESGTATAGDPVAKIDYLPKDGAKDANPATPVRLTVSNGTLDEVTLRNADGKLIKGNIGVDKRTWNAGEPLGFDRTYTWAGKATGTDGKAVEVKGSFTTLKPARTLRATINPIDNAVVGVGMPIKVQFDQDVPNREAVERKLEVNTSVNVPGSWAWVNGREVHWRPQKYWPENTKVKAIAHLYGMDYGDGTFGAADLETEFTIGRNQVVVANTASHKIDIMRNGQVFASYKASYGQDANPDLNTPNGTYIVMQKFDQWSFDNPQYGYTNVLKTWAVRFSNHGEFIHENNDNAGNINAGVNSSHGCINLLGADAKAYYDTAIVGDPVEVTGASFTMPAKYDTFDWQIPWEQWQTMSAIKK